MYNATYEGYDPLLQRSRPPSSGYVSVYYIYPQACEQASELYHIVYRGNQSTQHGVTYR